MAQTSVSQTVRTAVNSTIIGVQNVWASQSAQDYRRLLLERVRNRWFGHQGGALEHSPLLLEMEERLDLLGRQPNRMLLPGTRILKVFSEAEGKLVILGAAGSGKKEKLLELARDLLRLAQEEDGLMPVVLSLISWPGEEQSDGFFQWLVEEISDKHDGIGTELAKEWLRNRALILLLDDLDQIEGDNKTACVEGINGFLKRWDPVQIAVCGRTGDYEVLDPPRIKAGNIVELQPLTTEQIDTYLAGAELAALRALLEEDQTLRELASAPLYLGLLKEMYWGRAPEAAGQRDSAEMRFEDLWEDYVDCAFDKRRDGTRYEPGQAEGWLSWLARTMKARRQDQFWIERMQPDWLSTEGQRWYTICCWIITALVFGLPAGLGLGFAFAEGRGLSQGLAAGLTFSLISGLIVGIAYFGIARKWARALVMALALGLAVGLSVELVFGQGRGLFFGAIAAVIGLVFGLLPTGVKGDTRRIRIIEVLRWSWSRALLGFVLGVAWSIACGAIMGLALAGLDNGLAAGLFFASIAGPTLAVLAGMTGGGIQVEDKEIPNQGIRRSAISAIRFGLLSALATGLPYGLVGTIFGRVPIGSGISVGSPVDGLALGLVVGLFMGLTFGGITCIQHAVLRLVLRLGEPHLPLDLVGFFEYVEGLGLVRRRGGVYEFRHQGLQDHFADQSSWRGPGRIFSSVRDYLLESSPSGMCETAPGISTTGAR
jgi:hypothetical protein